MKNQSIHHTIWQVACIVVILNFALCFSAQAITYYVSPSGNDSNSGTSASQPVTLPRGARLAHAGDTVILLDGIYPAGTRASNSGADGSPITFIAQHRGQAILTGSGTRGIFLEGSYLILDGVTSDNAGQAGVYVVSRNTIVRNCTITNNGFDIPEDHDGGSGILVSFAADDSQFVNNYIAFNKEHGIYLSGGQERALVQRNYINGNGAQGIQINPQGPSNPNYGLMIRDNIILHSRRGHGLDSQGAHDSSYINNFFCDNFNANIGISGVNDNIVVSNNTIIQTQTTRPDFEIIGASTRVSATDNLLYHLVTSPLSILSVSNFAQSDNNLFWARAANQPVVRVSNAGYLLPAWQQLSGFDLHSSVIDPLFVNASACDNILAQGSAATGIGFIPPITGAPAQLTFRIRPANGTTGRSLARIQVSADDASGNLVSTFHSPVTISLGTHPSGAQLSGTTTNTAATGAATFSDLAVNVAGDYTLVASTPSLASVTSQRFTVSAIAPPTITQQASTQRVNLGQTATFSITASGTAPLSYQWQKLGSNISGATDPTYTTPPTVSADNGSYFRCIVSNPGGSTGSDPVTLLIVTGNTAPTITRQPQNMTVTVGQTATFSVTASGTSPLSYQWKKNGNNIPGASNSSYTSPATVLADNGAAFLCIVSNTVGSATSNTATLTVNAINQAPTVATPARALPNPVNGTTTSLSVLGADDNGEANLTYTWAVTNGPSGVTFSINGTNSAKNTAVTFTQPGIYTFQVTISDAGGLSVASSVNVTVVDHTAPSPPLHLR